MKQTLSVIVTTVMLGGFAGLPAAAIPRLPAPLQTNVGSDMLMQVRSHGHRGHRGHGHYGHGRRGYG